MLHSDPFGMICCSGGFPFIGIYGRSLDGAHSKIEHDVLGTRLIQIFHSGTLDASEFLVASGSRPPRERPREPGTTQSEKNGIIVFDISRGKVFGEYFGNDSPQFRSSVHGLASMPISASFASPSPRVIAGTEGGGPGSFGGQLSVFNLETGDSAIPSASTIVPRDIYRIYCVPEWSYSEVYVGTDKPQSLIRFDCRRGEVCKTGVCQEKVGVACGIAADVDRGILASASWDRQLKLWTRDLHECIRTIRLGDCGLCAKFVPEKHLYVVGTTKGRVEMWDSRSMANGLDSFVPGGQFLNDLALVDPEKFVFVSGSKNQLCLWNLQKKKLAEVTPASSEHRALVLGVVALQNDDGDDDSVARNERLGFLSSLDSLVQLRIRFVTKELLIQMPFMLMQVDLPE